MVKVRTALRRAFETAGRLTIVDTGTRVVLTDAAGSALAVIPDGSAPGMAQPAYLSLEEDTVPSFARLGRAA